MRAVFIVIFLVVCPLVLGYPWIRTISKQTREHLLACLPLGFFLELSLLQLLTFPFAFLGWSFSSLCWTLLAAIVVGCVVCIRFSGGVKLERLKNEISIPRKWSGWEIFYAILFLGLIGWQIYNAVYLDPTEMTYDDAYYIAAANDALTQNRLFVTDAYTGLATRLNVHRALQSSILYPAFIAYFSGVSVITLEHTILSVYHILLAYFVYGWLGNILFERREERLIFLTVISLLYIFGYYSHYSATFRLLGPNNQGKAFLAVSYTPLLLGVLICAVRKPYHRRIGILLMLFSIAAAGLSLFGTVAVIVNAVAVIGLSEMRKDRHWKHMWYLLWISLFPALYGGIFLLHRFTV